MPTTNEDSTLLQEANACAKSMAIRWIRSVFREVSVQTLKRQWIVTPNDDKGIKVTTLRVTQQHLEACELTCLGLGTFWCQRLRDAGQNQVAEWVREVMEEKHFWESDESVLGDESQHRSGEVERVQAQPAANDPTKQEVEPLPLPSNTKLIMTKIRQLGKRKIGQEPPPPLDRVSRTLDELGRNGETAWPYDWSIIEQAARNNVKRLYSETLKGRSRTLKTGAEYEVVPKSLVEREKREASQNATVASETMDNQQEIDAILASSVNLATMVERKRKAASEQSDEAQGSRRAPSPPLATIARPPSHFGRKERLSWKDDVVGSFSEQERDYMKRNMIHSIDDEPTTEVHSALGALKQVGEFHSYLQNQQGNDVEEVSDKKRRREERKCLKQRLFPHEPQKEDRKTKRAVTKLVRTIDGNKQHWMELDMSECLLEFIDPDSNQKTLCAFSSLEVTLKDEDASIAGGE